MFLKTPGSSKDTEAIEKNATPSTIQNDFDVICETRFRRNFLVLIVSSILSILLCWPIGVIAAWKSFKVIINYLHWKSLEIVINIPFKICIPLSSQVVA